MMVQKLLLATMGPSQQTSYYLLTHHEPLAMARLEGSMDQTLCQVVDEMKEELSHDEKGDLMMYHESPP